MKPISKSISYGYSKSVQLFEDSKKIVLVVSQYGIDGELCKLVEYRYDDYMKAVRHMHHIVINFCYPDLIQK